MTKFLAVVKREYIQRVRSKMFIISTILLPGVMSLFGIVPAIVLSIDAGGPMRVAVMDQTGKMYRLVEEALVREETSGEQEDPSRFGPPMSQRAFKLQPVTAIGPEAANQRAQLDARLKAREIDGYLILPPDFIEHGKAEFFNNNPGDLFTNGAVRSALNRALREQRLIERKSIRRREKCFFNELSSSRYRSERPVKRVVRVKVSLLFLASVSSCTWRY